MRIMALSLLAVASQACAPLEEPRSATVSQTTVTVDQRIELMGVIQLLSGYFLVSYLDSGYKRDAASFFAACSDHAAVKKFSTLSANGFDFNNVPEAFITLSEPLRHRVAARVIADRARAAGIGYRGQLFGRT